MHYRSGGQMRLADSVRNLKFVTRAPAASSFGTQRNISKLQANPAESPGNIYEEMRFAFNKISP
jgi:hypothetical protein